MFIVTWFNVRQMIECFISPHILIQHTYSRTFKQTKRESNWRQDLNASLRDPNRALWASRPCREHAPGRVSFACLCWLSIFFSHQNYSMLNFASSLIHLLVLSTRHPNTDCYITLFSPSSSAKWPTLSKMWPPPEDTVYVNMDEIDVDVGINEQPMEVVGNEVEIYSELNPVSHPHQPPFNSVHSATSHLRTDDSADAGDTVLLEAGHPRTHIHHNHGGRLHQHLFAKHPGRLHVLRRASRVGGSTLDARLQELRRHAARLVSSHPCVQRTELQM